MRPLAISTVATCSFVLATSSYYCHERVCVYVPVYLFASISVEPHVQTSDNTLSVHLCI